nr:MULTISPECIES: polyphosphate polymerase domain-containing protein [unclassified Enterococcus]
MKLKKVFQRKENKYGLSFETYDLLIKAIQPYMSEDKYGLHTILSLYYDTEDYQLIRHSMEKPRYKEKFRLRSYGVPNENSQVFLELKKKIQGVVYKRRLALNYQQAQNYHQNFQTYPLITGKEKQIQEEIDWVLARYQLKPSVLIAYDRCAFHLIDDEESDFRITFDANIRYRKEELDLLKGCQGKLVAPEIAILMEVKAMGAYPVWFTQILSQLNIHKISFSKYAQTYQRYIYPKESKSVIKQEEKLIITQEKAKLSQVI